MPGAAGSERRVLQDDFDNDVDALLEEGLCAPKKRRTEERYGDSDHPSDGETSVQPMMTKIKTVLKSESGREAARRLGERSGCREAVWAAVCVCRQEGPVGAGSLKREDTACVLPGCGERAPGRGGHGRGGAERRGCSRPPSEFRALCRVLGKPLEAGRTHSTVCCESTTRGPVWTEMEGSRVYREERLGCSEPPRAATC